MQELAVSSFSLRSEIGPVSFPAVDADGDETTLTLEYSTSITLGQFARVARERFGVDLIEICQVQIPDPAAHVLDDILSGMADGDVRLLSMPIDVGDIAHPDDAVRERSIAAHLAWFDIAARIEARFVRVNAISSYRDRASSLDLEVLDAVRRLSDVAHGLGLGLLLENKGGARDYPERLRDLFGLLDAGSVGLILDTGNFEPLVTAMNSRLLGVESGIADLELERVYEAVEMLAPFATVVHAKTHEFADDGTHGPMDVARALASVLARGFTGPISIEYEGLEGDPWINTARSVEIVRSVLA